jgi:hypothetical protein
MSQACSLCGTAIGEIRNQRGARLCEPCSRALPSFLESMKAPAAIVERDLTVVYSNSRLCGIAETCGDEAVGLKVGQALGCVHAEEAGICGQSEACLHCWLKRLVDLARISGEKLPDMPFDFTRKTGSHRFFRISAEKAGEAVVLMIRPQTGMDAAAGGLL